MNRILSGTSNKESDDIDFEMIFWPGLKTLKTLAITIIWPIISQALAIQISNLRLTSNKLYKIPVTLLWASSLQAEFFKRSIIWTPLWSLHMS